MSPDKFVSIYGATWLVLLPMGAVEWLVVNAIFFYQVLKDMLTGHAERDHTLTHAPSLYIAHYPRTLDHSYHNPILSLDDNKYYKDCLIT